MNESIQKECNGQRSRLGFASASPKCLEQNCFRGLPSTGQYCRQGSYESLLTGDDDGGDCGVYGPCSLLRCRLRHVPSSSGDDGTSRPVEISNGQIFKVKNKPVQGLGDIYHVGRVHHVAKATLS